ncbi:hypothetical protein D3OALGA1CA_4867 [Olavius algarvensis associated proteobacterium Delta 3]|nr:hypothetical protein D3OALGA1CA_4867 [Olavius algarvensis associated proteobacterium Delta 3]
MLQVHLNRKRRTPMIVCMAVLLLAFTGPVFASSEGGQGEAESHWTSTDTYRVMNFTVLFVGLFLLLRKPVANALGARISGIREQIRELESKKAEAEKQLAQYNEKLSQLDKEAGHIVENYIKQGEEAKARIIEEAKAAAFKLEEQAKRNIDNEFKKAKEKIQEEIVEQALAKAEEMIAGKITPDDQEKLVDEYIEKVVA